MRELCPFYFSTACYPELISGRTMFDDSAITACRNLQLPCRLICWNVDFMGILNIQKYSVFFISSEVAQNLDDNSRFLLINPGDIDDLDLVVLGVLCRESFGFKVIITTAPTSSMAAMVCLLHNFCFRQSDGVVHTSMGQQN